jgi:sarcosine oxidase subunit gamma
VVDAVTDIEPLENVAAALLLPHRGQSASLKQAVQARLGLLLPDACQSATAGKLRLLWAGHEQWLLLRYGDHGWAQGELEAALEGRAFISEQSSGRALFRLSGALARPTLERFSQVDLHPCSFRVGQVAVTRLGQIGSHLWKVSDHPDAWEIAVFSSFALSMKEQLRAAYEMAYSSAARTCG